MNWSDLMSEPTLGPEQYGETNTDDIVSDAVNLVQTSANKVQAELVRVNESKVTEIIANEVDISQSSIVKIKAQQLSSRDVTMGLAQTGSLAVSQCGIVATQAGEVASSNGKMGFVYAQTADLNEVTAGMIVGRQIKGRGPIHTTVLLAGQVDGPVETLIDTPRVVLGGLVTGIVVGLVLFVMNLLTGQKS
jgi:hypothetical protein